MKHKIYLDNAATTQVDPEVLEAMLPHFNHEYGNASSLHYAGLNSRVAVDRSAAKVAGFLGCDKSEVYFTSGATESDNMAILGVTEAIRERFADKIHVITTQVEHDAILQPCKQLARKGVEITYLQPDKDGMITAEELRKAVKPETVLVSIMYVNNEIGTILPIAEFGKMIASLNEKRKKKIYFHTDATQALKCCDCDVEKLGVDLLSLSAHKIYGPKGVGAIYVRKGTPLIPLVFGGHQQENVRPGTYNVPGIVGLGKAVELLSDSEKIKKENKKIAKLRDYLITQVQKSISDVLITGGLENRAPSNASFVIRGVEGESVLLMLSEKEIAVSTGSACSSGSLDPSHVLLSIGVKRELAHGSLRVTLGRFNTKEDIDTFAKALVPIVEKLRAISPLK